MKSILLVLVALMLTINANAGEWTPSGKVTLIYPKPSRSGIYFQHTNMVSGGCSVSSNLFLSADQLLFKESYSLLLSAYTSGKNVKIYVDGCQAGFNYPLIKEIIAE